MILAGDEVLRSQRGNNNAYCQDNEISWFDWGLVDTNRDMLRFTREMIALRRRHACSRQSASSMACRRRARRMPDMTWHGERLDAPPWYDGQPAC